MSSFWYDPMVHNMYTPDPGTGLNPTLAANQGMNQASSANVSNNSAAIGANANTFNPFAQSGGFGNMTNYYSGLGAAYGRATGGFNAQPGAVGTISNPGTSNPGYLTGGGGGGGGGGGSVFDTGTTPFNSYGLPGGGDFTGMVDWQGNPIPRGGGIGSDAARAPNQPSPPPQAPAIPPAMLSSPASPLTGLGFGGNRNTLAGLLRQNASPQPPALGGYSYDDAAGLSPGTAPNGGGSFTGMVDWQGNPISSGPRQYGWDANEGAPAPAAPQVFNRGEFRPQTYGWDHNEGATSNASQYLNPAPMGPAQSFNPDFNDRYMPPLRQIPSPYGPGGYPALTPRNPGELSGLEGRDDIALALMAQNPNQWGLAGSYQPGG